MSWSIRSIQEQYNVVRVAWFLFAVDSVLLLVWTLVLIMEWKTTKKPSSFTMTAMYLDIVPVILDFVDWLYAIWAVFG